ncbi:DUF5916 domain-containing protein [Daejeonella oryzae]|uniref:DUF5916 domain-containing protein n=1 Tax=Daejeonella oryzae TaxID=1122943 RepID=UPI00047C57B1|nr:DUF5916 domain-containing protein [Daejeonella oryzae]
MNKLVLFTLLGASISFFNEVRAADKEPEIKKINAIRIDKAPKIDGILDDEVWKSAPIASGFVQLRPVPGRMEKDNQKTEVRIVYDNAAIYVSARMHEVSQDSIARQLAPRDQVGNADFFGIVFDTYLDKINGNGFFVTAAGSQFDAKYSASGNEDELWNAVWESDVKIDETGWSVEMKIPYSALRFSSNDIQKWGVNMIRKRQNVQEQFFWNPLDPNKNGFINQSGELTGISNIKAPMRLSFSPYISSYVNNYPYNQPGIKNTSGSFNGGMDIKYGINQSFTLDMTLVPDFGQVQSDNQVLNLTPFEVQFNENRQFFTEGTELFSKGDLFYSRRIGSNPTFLGPAETNPGERITAYPTESKLLNATKISGRTAKGLGIGFFNAITNRMKASLEDDLGNTRLVEVQPLTNYNIFVLDQSLKNNSSLSFINTNVLRQGSAYDANVSAVDFNLNDKKNVWNIKGTGRISYLKGGEFNSGQEGYSYDLKFGKQSGKFVYNFLQKLTTDTYEQNDLGILFNRNFLDNSVFGEINLYKGKKLYNELHAFVQLRYSQRYKPRTYQNFVASSGMYMQFKNLWSVNANVEWQPEGNDFYESRNGLVYRTLGNKFAGLNLSSNNSKKYNAGFYSYITAEKRFKGKGLDLGFYQNYRINNKFSVGNDFSYEPRFNYSGWVGSLNNQTIFSRFDRQTVVNSVDAKYTFNTKMGINLRARHYWSNRINKDFYNLLADGNLEATSNRVEGANRNFNTFNLDMNYVWQFAPGSELTITWKDASIASENSVLKGYGNNFDHIFKSPQNNSLSFKILYYIDYLQLARKR